MLRFFSGALELEALSEYSFPEYLGEGERPREALGGEGDLPLETLLGDGDLPRGDRLLGE